MFSEVIGDKENVLKMLEWVQAELQEECNKNTQCKNALWLAFAVIGLVVILL